MTGLCPNFYDALRLLKMCVLLQFSKLLMSSTPLINEEHKQRKLKIKTYRWRVH